jgi:hypothetical protein
MEVSPMLMRSRSKMGLRSLVMKVCGRRLPDLPIEVPPWIGEASRLNGKKNMIAQSKVKIGCAMIYYGKWEGRI